MMVKQCGQPSSWLGGSPFKRGQLFVSHVNSSPHFVRKCPFYPWQLVSIETGPWEKSSCLGLHWGLCQPTWLHPAAWQPCINWTEQPSDSLRKQPTFRNTTSGFPVKWRLRNDCRNFVLLRCHYPVLGGLLIGRVPRENCNQKHYSDLGSDTRHHQYEIAAVISKRHFAEKPVVASPNFGCFLKRPLRLLSQIKILTIEANSTWVDYHAKNSV